MQKKGFTERLTELLLKKAKIVNEARESIKKKVSFSGYYKLEEISVETKLSGFEERELTAVGVLSSRYGPVIICKDGLVEYNINYGHFYDEDICEIADKLNSMDSE